MPRRALFRRQAFLFDFGAESVGPNELTLDVLNLIGKRDVSLGYVFPARNANGGRGTVNVGQSNAPAGPRSVR